MAVPSPLFEHDQAADALFLPWGDKAQMVAQLDVIELEYAAIRKTAAMLDSPHRGLLRISGKDRVDFLHRMLSNDVKAMSIGDVQRNFLLNAKGRIMADLLLIAREDATLIDLDIHQVEPIARELDNLLFGEDVKIENLSQSHHRISFHGPNAQQIDAPTAMSYRYDETGEIGMHYWLPVGDVMAFADGGETFRRIGWLAFNIARIEAGRPMFNIDFGADSLPHETGVLDEAVSFTAGCYRGQEIVARMQSLGHPAKVLVGFRAEGEAIPPAGAPVHDKDGPDAQLVGGVTSSTFAPMLSQAPIGFAIVRWSHREIGTLLSAPAEGRHVPLRVHELTFFRKGRT
ncbi:MAG: hypothetical protein GC162_15805 [Planctomycetes bacterium]|nr:hypothetical protein [Planctomycetota bacterium]